MTTCCAFGLSRRRRKFKWILSFMFGAALCCYVMRPTNKNDATYSELETYAMKRALQTAGRQDDEPSDDDIVHVDLRDITRPEMTTTNYMQVTWNHTTPFIPQDVATGTTWADEPIFHIPDVLAPTDGTRFDPKSTNNPVKLIRYYPLAVDTRTLVDHVREGHKIDVVPLNDIEFSFRLKPETCDPRKPYFMIYLIKTRPYAFDRRDAVRKTWGNDTLMPNVAIKRVFLVGERKGPDNMESKLADESRRHGDILRGNFTDDYEHTAMKMLMGIRWSVTSCRHAQFLAFADDDILLRPRVVVSTLKSPKIKQIKKLHLGYFSSRRTRARRNKTMGPRKDPIVSAEEYPFDFYPTVVPAGNYYLNMDYAIDIDIAARYIKYWPRDDVYLAIIKDKLDVQPTRTTKIAIFRQPSGDRFMQNPQLIAECSRCLSFCFELKPKKMISLWEETKEYWKKREAEARNTN